MKPYDLSKASEYFRAKMSFTTGSHELELLVNSRKNPDTFKVVDVEGGWDTWVQNGFGVEVLDKSA